MDYLIGSLVTIATIALVLFALRYVSNKTRFEGMQYSQSYIYELISPMVMEMTLIPAAVESQGTKHNDSRYITFLSINNKAYWIKDNTLYVAPIDEDGNMDQENAKHVDTMAMNKVQLNEVMFIVEELTRGKGYDSRGTGK
jgi:hypothetical protein